MKRLIIAGLFFVFAFSGFAFSPGNNFYDQTQPSLMDKDRFELKIYPNPTETGQVTLEMNKGEISEIRLINIAGKEVVLRKMDFATPKYTLRLERVPSGIYFVRVKTAENKMVVKKLVVSSH
ncbi:Por secretion system C-terminal sorting domain-containing protein [Mariniphaga anaerophila]|uniref:Por secretion system C-terminal sorting domain-containing protein n=1 Tax=Mariniphaga anaerophila TaxID=1484053 RepID=A0A1M4YFK2_9BACT|nr:T9SS type A sorting domain-containing protein [Mariniphaga anaerophila]SHF04489.1 Por secretion system C-terminal sorting domain-containing protein [Mariniphaga anaerophila]